MKWIPLRWPTCGHNWTNDKHFQKGGKAPKPFVKISLSSSLQFSPFFPDQIWGITQFPWETACFSGLWRWGNLRKRERMIYSGLAHRSFSLIHSHTKIWLTTKTNVMDHFHQTQMRRRLQMKECPFWNAKARVAFSREVMMMMDLQYRFLTSFPFYYGLRNFTI